MIPFYEWFYNVILTSANSVPIQSLWTAFFSNPVDLNRAIQASRYENLGPWKNLASLAAGAAVNTVQSANGALFCNSVTIPGDGMNTSKTGPEGSGLIKGNISNGRQDMENLRLSFIDTNMSFADYNLRPWAIYASHKSLKDPTVKTTITVIQWTKTGEKKPLLPRAIWTFHDACPVSLKSDDWKYEGDNVVYREVEFAYNFYALNADPGITSIQTIESIIGNQSEKHDYQPVNTPKGGLDSHSSAQLVQTASNGELDTPRIEEIQHQKVEIPEDDVVSRGINIGLEILNGNSNVTIESQDSIDRLQSQGEELLRNVNVPFNDVPSHSSGTNQVGYVEKQPTGPYGEQPDHITRESPERVQSGRISVGGNSKEQAKANLDTPLFFPGDGDEGNKKITGRTVGGDLDTPQTNTLSHEQVVVERTGDVSNNIDTQLVNIDRNDTIENNKRVNQSIIIGLDGELDTPEIETIPHQPVEIEKNPNNVGRNIPLQIITINRNDTSNGARGSHQPVSIDANDNI